MQENVTALHRFKREWQESRGNGHFHSYRTEFPEFHEMRPMMMLRFHATLATGIATCLPGAELPGLIAVLPGHSGLLPAKRKVPGSCMGKSILFLSLSFPRCKRRMLSLTSYIRMAGRVHSLAKGSEALAVTVLRKSRKLLQAVPAGRASKGKSHVRPHAANGDAQGTS